MSRFLKTYRASSGSQFVYFTNEQTTPSGVLNPTLISSVQLEKGTLPDEALPTPVESWTLDGLTGLTGSVDNTTFDLATGTSFFGPGPNVGTNSLFFNGSTRWATTATGSLQLTGSMSLSLFVFPAGLSTGLEYLATYAANTEIQSGNSLYNFRFDTRNALEVFLESGAGSDTGFDVDINCHPGQWIHLVYLRDGNNTNFVYINGTQVISTSAGTVDGGSSSFLNLGAWPGNSGFFTGFLYSLKIFDTALSPDVIRKIKNNVLGN